MKPAVTLCPTKAPLWNATQHYMGTARGKVYNIYKKQALKLAEGIDLPEDHLAFMCEFDGDAGRSCR